MSWALESNDSTAVFVTGTIVPNASPALEVVFALRETKRMPKPVYHSYPPLGSMSASVPFQHLNPPRPPQAPGMGWLSTPQEQQTLTRSADFPELYIGPPRRAPGRPEGSASSKSRIKPQASTSSLPAGASSSRLVETRSELKEEIGRRSKQKTKHRPTQALPTHSPFICEPLTRHTATVPEASATGVPAFHPQSHPLGQTQIQPHPQVHTQTQLHLDTARNPLLGLLSTTPSTSSGHMAANTTPEQQAALVTALQRLLAANPHLLQLAATSVVPSASSVEQSGEGNPVAGGNKAEDKHDDADSDIVILDSSTIDTTAFRKPSHRQLAASDDASSLTTKQESPMPGMLGTDSSPLPVPSGQEGTPASSQTSTPAVTPETQTPTSRQVYSGRTEGGNVTPLHVLEMPATPPQSRTRKRTLDEYIQGEAHSSPPCLPPSPSPSVTRASSARRALTVKRILSSPTAGTKSTSSPSMRLPSMLGSMRSLAALSSCLQASSSGSSTHRNPGTDTPLNIGSDTTLLKRRRTLNEVMEEREARRNAKVRKRSSSGRKLGMCCCWTDCSAHAIPCLQR
ncbi:hypothetical protein V8E55_011836 [Tylopilus felleus]